MQNYQKSLNKDPNNGPKQPEPYKKPKSKMVNYFIFKVSYNCFHFGIFKFFEIFVLPFLPRSVKNDKKRKKKDKKKDKKSGRYYRKRTILLTVGFQMRNTYQGNAAEVIWVKEIIQVHVLHLVILLLIEFFDLLSLNFFFCIFVFFAWILKYKMPFCMNF